MFLLQEFYHLCCLNSVRHLWLVCVTAEHLLLGFLDVGAKEGRSECRNAI